MSCSNTEADSMRKILLSALLLSGLVHAAPYESKSCAFRADFPGKVVATRLEPGTIVGVGLPRSRGARYFESAASSRFLVAVTDHPEPAQEILDRQVKGRGPVLKKVESRRFQHQGYPAISWSGFDPEGVPLSILLVATPQHTYYVAANGLDLGLHRAFLDSFHITTSK